MAEYPMKVLRSCDLGEPGDKVIAPEKQATEAFLAKPREATFLGGRPESLDFGENTKDAKAGEGYGPTAIKEQVREQKKERTASRSESK